MATDPNRVKELVLEATEMADAPARAAYLDRACGDDVDLRGRVEALLRAHARTAPFSARRRLSSLTQTLPLRWRLPPTRTTPRPDLSLRQANFGFDQGLNRTCPLGRYEPNRLWLFDMHGNVFEWCHDPLAVGGPEPGRPHIGGSFHAATPDWCRASGRFWGGPNGQQRYLGFRVARVPSAPAPP
jgi:formylglycine-generating enzyme required for sulfatase activity